jgi:squalene cyclase
MNLSKSIKFVENNSTSPFDHVRLEFILNRSLPKNDELNEIITTQRSDGSWSPFWAQGRSSLDATCYRLALLEQVGIKNHIVIEHAINYLLSQMNELGYFEEDSSLSDVCPPWARPGDIKARLYLTTNCAFWINYFTADLDKRIVSYLRGHISEGRVDSFLHTQWILGGLFYSLELFEDSREVFHSLNEIIDEMSADNLAWLINTLIASGVDRDEKIIKCSINRLINQINENGSWSSDDGSWKDIHTTLEAIRAITYVSSS